MQQHESKRWYEERWGRLTASVFGKIVRCKQYEGHAKRKLYPNKSTLSTAAIQCIETLEDSQQVQLCGLYVSVSGFLAASPDGIVCSRDGTPVGVLEIKCPYTQKNSTVSKACLKSSFFCEKSSEIHLIEWHDYYYQVQGQMAILNLPWCDFVVWTLCDMHTERIHLTSLLG